MKQRPPNGLVGQTTFVVGPEHVIDFALDGMPAVFSTPKMIGLLERTARESLMPYLEHSERTVGVEIDVRHLAPAPVGARVTLTTRVISSDGIYLNFLIEARDEVELLARGVHKRAVIRVDVFARRVEKKRPGSQSQ